MLLVRNEAGTNVISAYNYALDTLGRRTAVSNAGLAAAQASAAQRHDWTYNNRSELTNALTDLLTATNSYVYCYDPIGSRTVSTNNAEVMTYLANALNQYTNIADGVTNRPTYDLDGNMLTCGGWTFSWDGENRLNSASNGTTSVSFGYDHMGRRFRKIVAGATTTTNTFLHDGWAMVREVQGTTTNAYVYGPDLSGSMQGAGTIGGLLFGTFGGTATVSSAFYAYDANGNVTTLIDTNGATAASYTYDPYGNTIAATGVLATINPFRFSTKYLDAETGFYYYGYRYYSSSLGRWLSRDPSGEEGGYLLYTFCLNNPANGLDPFGCESFSGIELPATLPVTFYYIPYTFGKEGTVELASNTRIEWPTVLPMYYRITAELGRTHEQQKHWVDLLTKKFGFTSVWATMPLSKLLNRDWPPGYSGDEDDYGVVYVRDTSWADGVWTKHWSKSSMSGTESSAVSDPVKVHTTLCSEGTSDIWVFHGCLDWTKGKAWTHWRFSWMQDLVSFVVTDGPDWMGSELDVPYDAAKAFLPSWKPPDSLWGPPWKKTILP